MTRILIVEDSATQAHHLEEVLEGAGYAAVLAPDAETAIVRMQSETFDLVLSDIVMPGMSGYQLCRTIKNNPKLARLPIMLLTTLDHANDVLIGLAAGADNFITKPFDADVLLGRIRRVLDGKSSAPATDVLKFQGEAFRIDSPKEQILTFLLSTFEDYASAKSNENEALAREMENKRKSADELRRANEALAEAHGRLAGSYDDLKKEQALRDLELRRMEIELQAAQLVQKLLIPDAAPADIPGLELAFLYQPAAETGGDWLGFHHHRERGQLTVMIGDVTGHGLASAMLTAAVCAFFSTVQHLGLHERPTAELLHALDRVLADIGRRERGMTFGSSVIDYGRRLLLHTSAAHPSPFVLRHSQLSGDVERDARRAVSTVCSMGPILGFDVSATPFGSRSLELETGDVVLWYTDGLIENRDASGEQIGGRRLRRWLVESAARTPAEICRALETEVAEFLRGRPLDDDIAAIVARVG